MTPEEYTQSSVYKKRIKRGMLCRPSFKPTDWRYYISPRGPAKTRKFLRILTNPFEYIRRFIVYPLFLWKHPAPVRMNKLGYAKFYVSDVTGGEEFLRRILALIDKKKLENAASAQGAYSKLILSYDEVFDHSFILDFALCGDMLGLAGRYLRTVPISYAIQLWQAAPDESHAGSPCFHLDGLDTSCVRIYIYLSDVGLENGPFSLLPIDISNRVVKATKYSGGVISDEEMYKPCLSGCHPYPLHLGCSQSPE